ncbi:Vacuolar protein sorting-associated protein 16 like [Dissostichus eleginoides]|uniref:Vacuolar protein sorting-associated protein 16 like n=1 Tax=Dissostichus eleginoides TaxID=100907 RepID=A0AAD9ETA7_DISEL|nr:Vacuolar protein sorting-associated protein 16 like [Dissostichus eleginoides]
MSFITANWNPLGEAFYRSWKSGPVVQVGWTVSDELLLVQEDGSVLIYDVFGTFKRHFSMGQEVVQSQVLEAQVFHSPYGTGVAIVTGSSRFTLATNIDDLKLRRLPEVPGLGPQSGSIVHMSVSFSYKYLALFTETGHLWDRPLHLQVSDQLGA